MNGETVMHVQTRPCPRCGKSGTVTLRGDQIDRYTDWLGGNGLIQDMLLTVPVGDREQIMTGYHSRCFDEKFRDDEQ